jgi:hypothetical protein
MANKRFKDSSGFEEVPSEMDKALALVPEYDASKEEEPSKTLATRRNEGQSLR